MHRHEHGHGHAHSRGSAMSHQHGRMVGVGHAGHGRRGETGPALLALLREKDMHGYQMLQEISDRTDGAWNPSPGSIYPALQQLEDQGLVTSEKVGGKRVFSLTEAGRKQAETVPPEGPWAQIAGDEGPERDLRNAFGSLTGATSQIGRAGSVEQIARATEILNDARKQMYTMLAGDE